MGKRPKTPGVFVDRTMIDSSAFRELGGTAHVVLMDFLAKRIMAEVPIGPKRKDTWTIVNNGQITYPYSEAEKKGISRPVFMRALDQLIERGFIDIAQSGAGVFRARTFYAISDRWRKWGTDEFVSKSRPRKKRWTKAVGFQRGHAYHPPQDGA